MKTRPRSPAEEFVRRARARGLKARVARLLEPAARELFGERPEDVLDAREAFEAAATHTVIGDAGNLELSYSLVDALAGAVETLDLARASDVPDPFRRVWIENATGARKRGVVLRCERGEVAVFCPPSQDRFTEAGELMQLSYRGFSSSVEYDLVLGDAVRLPEALVLHLNRPGGAGAIGRGQFRVDVRIPGRVRALGVGPAGAPGVPIPCEVLDVSLGGLRIASELPQAAGQLVEVRFELSDGNREALSVCAEVCWNRSDAAGLRTQGLQLAHSAAAALERYGLFLESILPADVRATLGEVAEYTLDDERAPEDLDLVPAAIPFPAREGSDQRGAAIPLFEDLEAPAPADVHPAAPLVGPHPSAEELERAAEYIARRIVELEGMCELLRRRSIELHGFDLETVQRALGEARELLETQGAALDERGAILQDAWSVFVRVQERMAELDGDLKSLE